MEQVRRVYVEKKEPFAVEAASLYKELVENLALQELKKVRIINRYDVAGLTNAEYEQAKNTIFSEATVDYVYDEQLAVNAEEKMFAVEYLPGQYDQRADSAAQCVQILTQKERPLILSAKVIILQGNISIAQLEQVKKYYINPVESREATLEKPKSLDLAADIPADVTVLTGFIEKTKEDLEELLHEQAMAMSLADLQFCQNYFQQTEKRDPTLTEIKLIDTYWSDHCRHTTFLTAIEEVEIEKADFTQPIVNAYQEYLQSRDFVYGSREKDICLMDIAVIGMKELRQKGLLPDLDESEEINACSIVVEVDVDGKPEEWLVMFKNETHNHPTEIEPFGGAATCLGGAIRDPLSGRSYVYQAMRVTGSADPRTKLSETLSGKLPQRKITTGAAAGYSSYGNQIGLATGQVAEVYHEDFVAKRMEIGAVIGAAPKKNVVREKPLPGDLVVLLGGKTGRDGCGGATGSSKEHTEESLLNCGAEVQKGNPPTERKIQRLFRNPVVSTMIKRCNDFGAGGVSVAIGELTEGLVINLDLVPKKYEGLDGTELAISESQERMAVVIAAKDKDNFLQLAETENLEATVVAEVTEEKRLKMCWRGQNIVDISREFLNTNGIKQTTKVVVEKPSASSYFASLPESLPVDNLAESWLVNLSKLNVCSQKGLVERFDSTIGAGTVFMPFGGKYQSTPAEGMVAKIPVLEGETTTGTIMTYGYNPYLAKWSPFHGALYAVLEAVSKVVALGGDFSKVRLTLQEYFEKLGQSPVKWGKPFSALLGAFYAQKMLNIPAIGGKDSMSGTFKDLNVPPTLVAFAVTTANVEKVVSQEFKQKNSQVVLLSVERDAQEIPNFVQLQKVFATVQKLIAKGLVLACSTVKIGGLAATLSKMCLGNRIGLSLENPLTTQQLFATDYCSFVLEMPADADLASLLGKIDYRLLGHTQEQEIIAVNGEELALSTIYSAWSKPLENIFPSQTAKKEEAIPAFSYKERNISKPKVRLAKPKVLIPVFPGTNCEYDSARAFSQAGAEVDTFVVRNLTSAAIDYSVREMSKKIKQSQIIMLPGGFSAGDEPDGSGKFIATFFRNPEIKEAVMELLKQRDGLMLGICNGFQALIKLGLVPYGEIREITEECPTLTYNKIGRHVSCMVQTKVASVLSPWLNKTAVGETHTIAVSHGEGRFVAAPELLEQLGKQGQIATQYVDLNGQASLDIAANPNGSAWAIEGITSPDGRVLGKMGHSERWGQNIVKNVPGEKDQQLFVAGVEYFA